MKLLLGFFVILMASSAFAEAPAFDHKPTKHRIVKMLKDERLAELADSALDSMFTRAVRELQKAGYDADAAQMRAEWEGTYHGMLTSGSWDTGDHLPVSDWLAVQYQKLEDRLGVTVMELTHLRDIWVLNFTIPVIFAPHQTEMWCTENLAKYPDDTCAMEYQRHFAGTRWASDPDPFRDEVLHHGFSGVVSYWVTWASCEAALWGSDATLLCGLAGDAVEFAIEKFVAPKVSQKIWESKN